MKSFGGAVRILGLGIWRKGGIGYISKPAFPSVQRGMESGRYQYLRRGWFVGRDDTGRGRVAGGY